MFYIKDDIVNLDGHEGYYMPQALFNKPIYKVIRLEVKWAYVACVNTLINSPSYDKEGNAFIKDDNPQMIEMLKKLANKKVNQEKMNGYLEELEEKDLLERKGRDIYLKKI